MTSQIHCSSSTDCTDCMNIDGVELFTIIVHTWNSGDVSTRKYY